MNRRDLLKFSLAGSAGVVLTASAHAADACATDGTPAQFVPKRPADAAPQEGDIAKFPKCPYCGMDRKVFHHSRMLIQYSDDLPDATCSLHCVAISLSLNIDREPKHIWVGDNAAPGEAKPLVEVDDAIFLIGSRIKGVMTKRSKVAYSDVTVARAMMAEQGGELAKFDTALLAAYTDMAQDAAMVRKNREERRQRMMQKNG